MNYFNLLLLAATVIFFVWIWFEIRRAPVERDDMTQDKHKDAQ
jgi:hypothetical protein